MPATVADVDRAAADVDRAEAQAQARLAELRPQLPALGAWAMSSPRAAEQFAELRNEIAVAEAALQGVKLERVELARRQAEVRAGEPARQAAMLQARKLQAGLEAQYAEWDAHVAALGDLTRALLASWDAQDAALEVTGRRPSQNREQQCAIAFNLAFRAAIGSKPRAILELDGLQLQRPKSLVDGGFRYADPLYDDDEGSK